LPAWQGKAREEVRREEAEEEEEAADEILWE